MSTSNLELFKKVLKEGVQYKETGQGISVKVNAESIEFAVIPQPVIAGGSGGGKKSRSASKKKTLAEVEEHFMEHMDTLQITEEADFIKVLPQKFLGEAWGEINDKVKEFVGGYCWQKDLPGREKHWRIPKK